MHNLKKTPLEMTIDTPLIIHNQLIFNRIWIVNNKTFLDKLNKVCFNSLKTQILIMLVEITL